uniref:Cholesterol side-chain cleavage enzyme, mitochondrial n=1 Tax=Cairina moschata TaxID=8855 RepID=A0A8C3CKG2_CAIMO
MGCIRPDAMGMGGSGLFTQGRALGGFGVKPCCLLTPPVVAGRSWVSTRASTSSAPGTRPRSSGRRGCCPSASACPPGWLTATTATSPTACSSSEPPKPCPAAPPPPEPSLELGAAGSCRGRRVLGVSDGGSPPPRAACDPTVSRRTGEAWRSDRLTLNKEVLSPRVVEGFVPLLSEVGEDFVRRARAQVQKSGRERWTADFSHELFRFALESVCHVLYGERLGLLQDFVDPEAQRFIDAVTLMFHTTSPMLYLPPALLRGLNARTWRDHVHAWDAIFTQADKCIQNVYRDLRLQRKGSREYGGILSSLLLQDKLPLDDIKASVTEMMAGGVDTTSVTLQWAMFELARSPGTQEQLRAEVLAAKHEAAGDRVKMLKSTPLLKAAIKETLRLHPVAVTLQRYTVQEVVLQDYRIPPKTLVQVGLYAMGRDPEVFPKPEQFSPERWLLPGSKHFKGLSFGFGPRQCLGRRIAELEMQLFLMHILENFKIETKRAVEVGTKFDLILLPDKPIYLTLRPLQRPA